MSCSAGANQRGEADRLLHCTDPCCRLQRLSQPRHLCQLVLVSDFVNHKPHAVGLHAAPTVCCSPTTMMAMCSHQCAIDVGHCEDILIMYVPVSAHHDYVQAQYTRHADCYSITKLTRHNAGRGAYRASAAKWFHPDSISTAGSEQDPHISKAKRVKLKKASSSSSSSSAGSSRYGMQFRVPLQLSPVLLGFRLYIGAEGGSGKGQYVGPASSRHFTIPVGLQPGYPLPQGAAYMLLQAACQCSLTGTSLSQQLCLISVCQTVCCMPVSVLGSV